MSDIEDPVTSFTFKKHNIKNRGGRKRKNSSSDNADKSGEDSDTPAVVVPHKRAPKNNPNIQSTGGKAKSRTAVKNTGTGDSDEEKVTVSYKSGGVSATMDKHRENATATYDLDTDVNHDAQAIFEKSVAVNAELEGKADDKIYRGINNYARYYKNKDTAAGNASSGFVRKGPIRAPANLRVTVRWDYQPDICKDYKETGFCGFGDSCKFLHDRSDYKQGWQLERDEQTAARAAPASSDDDDGQDYEIHSDDERLPFKCFICRQSFVEPIVTKCKHYFCEKCALENYKKSTRCYICSQQTGGVFNPAKELADRLKKAGAEGVSEPESSDGEG